MISHKFLNFILLIAFLCSFLAFSVDAEPLKVTSSLSVPSEGTKLITNTPDPESSRRILPISILVYTQYTDTSPGGEWEHTMTAIDNTYGTDYYYANLTDYTQLDTTLPGHDILLILEQDNANPTITTAIGTAWASSLIDFVNSGGIVILMDYSSGLGFGSHIYNEAGLMQINDVGDATGATVNLVNTSNALARGVANSWTASDGSLAFDVSDGITVVDNSTDSVVVHKVMGKGHVVLLGFDLYSSDPNYEQLLGNAIRLHRHVVFDNSHNQGYSILGALGDYADDLVTAGFAVSSMDGFSPAFFNASDVLVLTRGDTNYSTAEKEAIKSFVAEGGGLYLTGEWSYPGIFENIYDVAREFGYSMNTTFGALYDSDDNTGQEYWPFYNGANLHNHSLMLGVNRVEFYAGNGFLTMPANAVSIITTDTDGTAKWGEPLSTPGTTPADGVTVMAASIYEAGRVVVSGDTDFLRNDSDTDSDATNDYYDSDNDVLAVNTIRWLSAAGLKERLVLFDESHGPTFTATAQFLEWANYMSSNGYTVHWMSSFQTSLLDEVDILVICDGTSNHTTNEEDAIEAFVAEGGGLFLLGDYDQYGQEVDSIGNRFGIDRNDTSWLVDSDDNVSGDPRFIVYNESNFGIHPIMEGISRIELYTSTALDTIGNSTALMSTDTDGTSAWDNGGITNGLPVFAATQYEWGRVVYVTDFNFLSSSDVDGDGDINFYDSDHRLFAVNAFQWLAENHAPVVNVTTPNGGEIVSGYQSIIWQATDPNNDSFLVSVYYSADNGNSWVLISGPFTNTNSFTTIVQWDSRGVPDGTQYLIRVEATDTELTGQDESDAVFTIDNNGPTITNVNHSPNSPIAGGAVVFSADVVDISGVKNVTCYFSVNSGSWRTRTMTKSSGDTYTCTIYNFTAGDTVDYYIKAYDDSPLHFASTSGTFSFVVIEATPTIPTPGFSFEVVVIFLLLTTTLIFILSRKRRVHN
ncbi:MAG: hypothetical protein ACFFCZ_18900 [Promethearchaeota archaeon]